MLDDIQHRIEQITPAAGYLVSPRKVILIDDAGEMHEQPMRTVGLLQDTQGCCGVFLRVSPGLTETALRHSITTVLSDQYTVDAQDSGLPLLIESNQPTEGNNASTTEKQTIAAKVESTIGTAESLTASEGVFNAYGLDIQGDIEVEEREGQGGFDRLAGVPGRRRGTMTFSTDLEWDGTATVPVWASVLLPGCGFVNSSGVFTPRSESPGLNVKTLTIAAYKDGLLKQLAGAVGNVRFVLPSGRKCYAEWSFEGVWQAVTDVALIAPTYPSDTVIRFASATLTYDSENLCVEQMSIDAGNSIIMRECSSTAAGFISGLITDRYPMIEANPEATLVGTDDPYGDWLAGTEAALSVVLDGPSTSDITFSVPKAQHQNVQEGERDKLIVDDITWSANKNGATQDECMSITFNETA